MIIEHVIAIGRPSLVAVGTTTAHVYVADCRRIKLVSIIHTEREFLDTLMTLLARDASPLRADQIGER